MEPAQNRTWGAGVRVRTVDSRTGMEVIPFAECLRLLGNHQIGRLSFVVDAADP